MFGDLNRVTLLGNVTKDPELRYTPSGTSVISFSLATNRRYKKGEEWVDEVNFHNIVVWNNAEELSKRVKKGTRMYLEGRLATRSWDGQDGKKNYKTEVIVERLILVSRFEGERTTDSTYSSESPIGSTTTESDFSADSTNDSIDPNDLPF